MKGRAALLSAWQVALGAGCGAAVGAVLFEATRISGRPLYLGAGTLLGACLPLLSRRLRGRFRLSEMKLRIAEFSDLTFIVDEDARLVAWRLYVEVSTRVSTQPLADDTGLIREAMDSLHALFRTTREALKHSRPSAQQPVGRQSVEHFAIRMLNHELRPFLSKWHPLLREYERAHPGGPEAAWPANAQCRRELERVSREVMKYALGFAELARVSAADRILAPPDPAVSAEPAAQPDPAELAEPGAPPAPEQPEQA